MISLLDLYTKEAKPKPAVPVSKNLYNAKWFTENLILDRRIGIGTYSKVYAAHSIDQSECAVKVIDNLTNHESIEYQKRLVIASNLCSSLAHSLNMPQIYRFEDRVAWKGNNKVHQVIITMERVSSNLYEIQKEKMKTNSVWTQDTLIRLLLSICNALGEACKRELPHFDIHERNIFVEEEKSIFLLGDLGLPKMVKKRKNNLPYESDYLAPEAFGVKSFKDPIDFFKADVYSVGLVILKLICMKDTFTIKDRGQIPQLLKDKRNEYPFIIKILQEQMLLDDPSKRDDIRNVKYQILTINFDLAFGSMNSKDVKFKKRPINPNNLETKDEMREAIDIGQAYEHFGLNRLAKKEYNKVLTRLQKHDDYSKESAQIHTMCLERLGIVHLETKKYNEALETFMKLHGYLQQESIEYLLGANNPIFIQVFHYIGVTYYHLGDLAKSLSYLEQGHELGKTRTGDSEVNVKIRDLFMGIMRFMRSEYPTAVGNMLSVADFLTEVSHKNDSDNIESLLMIAEYYRKLNANREALDVYLKAKELILEAYGEDSDEYVSVSREIATTQKNVGDLKSAFNIQLNALEKIRKSGDRNTFAEALMELADTLFKQEKYREALFSAEMAFKVFNRIYWLKHEKTIKAFKFFMSLVKKSPNPEAHSHYKQIEDLMVPEERGKVQQSAPKKQKQTLF